MNAPSHKEVSDMQRLIDLMNVAEPSSNRAPVQDTRIPERHSSAPAYVPTGSNDAADMKRILESFYSASGEALETTMEVAEHDYGLREALGTKRTNEGAIIGSWEVRAKLVEGKAGRKTYDVLHAGSKKLLFQDLVIFEAAHAIVRYLNKGLTPEHRKIEEIADLEETFRRNRQDAVVFKKRYERCTELKESEAGSVFEARYQKARAQAIVASDQIKTILDNIRS